MTRGSAEMRGDQRAMVLSVDGITSLELQRGGRSVVSVPMDAIIAALSGKET